LQIFTYTTKEAEMPMQGRRSRSGRGSHGWPTFGPIFFFSTSW